MSNPKTVLLVGGSGQLGNAIINALIAKNSYVHIRVLGRHHDEEVLKLGKGRVSFIVGDLGKMTASELDTAVKGVDAVVSALMGDPDAMVKGQIALIDAAKRAGVRQFLPSAFGSESRAVSKDAFPMVTARRAVDEYLIASGVPYTIVNIGWFTECALVPFIGLISMAEQKVNYWGDNPDWKLEMTTYADSGKIVAETLYDTWALNRYVGVHGDAVSPQDLQAYLKELTGKGELERKGSIEELQTTYVSFLQQGQFFPALSHFVFWIKLQWHTPKEDADRYHDVINFVKTKDVLAAALVDPATTLIGPKSMGKM